MGKGLSFSVDQEKLNKLKQTQTSINEDGDEQIMKEMTTPGGLDASSDALEAVDEFELSERAKKEEIEII